VDRNILRLATYEFLYDAETPKTIVINEAIEVARRFSAQESPQFINGILDSIRKEVETWEGNERVAGSCSCRETEKHRGPRIQPLPYRISLHANDPQIVEEFGNTSSEELNATR